MRRILLAALVAFGVGQGWAAEDGAGHAPQLLLSPKLLRRLKRDQERQTVRWMAFETRIKTVPDSPERGFELALYHAVTGDEERGKEAVAWSSAHPCERRQAALIRDWVGDGMVAPTAACPAPESLRDQAFAAVISGGDLSALADQVRSRFVPQFAKGGIRSSAQLYEVLELFAVLRANGGGDVRTDSPQFFRNLPVEFLLSLKPKQVDRPDWITHIAALALVSLDPNLEASQFLQGWAMEDRQRLREGPGVAYELLWADPYLPGIAYQNLDPWIYDETGARLFARSSWQLDACWIAISGAGKQQENCPAGWQERPAEFGSLRLIPMPAKCLEISQPNPRESVVLWQLVPGEKLSYRDKKDGKEESEQAGASGLWHPGANLEGKVCRR